jgi:hypothetical protein
MHPNGILESYFAMGCSNSLTLPGQRYLRKAFGTSEDNVSIVFLNVMTTLLLHATLSLFKSATFDDTHPVVSVDIHYLKAKHYDSECTGHRLCISIRQHNALVEGRL